MKKRVLSIIAMLCIIFSAFTTCSFASAETIALPAGLQFGMAIAQATAVSGYDSYTLKGNYFESYFNECNYPFSLEARLIGKATVGELPADVNVYFDEKGLKQVEYTFSTSNKDSSVVVPDIATAYDYVETNLQSKYGIALDTSTHKHTYMPVVDRALYFSWTSNVFGIKNTVAESISITQHKLYSISINDESSVYIDHFIQNRNSSQYHMLTYTFYDFIVEQNQTTNSNVGF